jgi:hypothetical protein
MNETIRFESGHILRDNGSGDYNFFCPEKFGELFFMPYMIARTCPWGRRAHCPYCKKSIGLPLEEPHA